MIQKFVPSDSAECRFCTHPYEVPDLVGIWLGSDPLVICASHALELVKLLIDRYYPAWGQALLPSDTAEAENEACAREAEAFGRHYPTSVFPEDGTSTDCISASIYRHAAEQIAAAIRARNQ